MGLCLFLYSLSLRYYYGRFLFFPFPFPFVYWEIYWIIPSVSPEYKALLACVDYFFSGKELREGSQNAAKWVSFLEEIATVATNKSSCGLDYESHDDQEKVQLLSSRNARFDKG